ncbi:MAG: hypothetical protein AAFZ91_11250 [Pseudomonadota bacterium]
MGKNSFNPEFGQNGAVLNSDTMSDGLREKYEASFRKQIKGEARPRVWPQSAIAMLALGAFLIGMAFATGDTLFSITSLPGFGLIVAAHVWRSYWGKHVKRN